MEHLVRETLPNGVRLVVQERPASPSVAVALTVGRGARCEAPEFNGATHFAEHLLFKGTESRSVRDIAREIDLEGGQLNAWTSMDCVRLHTRVATDDLDPALALIADMALASTFPEPEVERERGVILEEIAEVYDVPSDLCMDTLLEAMFAPHAIGQPILGRPERVASFTREALLDYWRNQCTAGNLILSIAGGVTATDAKALAERRFGALPSAHSGGTQPSGDTAGNGTGVFHARNKVLVRESEQVHFCAGYPGAPLNDARRQAMWLFDQILGGGMGSRLFQEIRERRGLAYTIGSSYTGMLHEGYLLQYGSTSPERIEEVLRVAREETVRLLNDGPSEEELEGARRQAVRAILLASETNAFHAGRNADRLLYDLEWMSDAELVERFRAITRDEVVRAAREILGTEEPALAIVGPVGEGALERVSSPPC